MQRGLVIAGRMGGTFACWLALSALTGPSAAGQQAGLRVVVRNELDLARGLETVELDAAALAQRLSFDDLRRVRVHDERTREELLAQAVDGDGDGRLDRLVFQSSFGPREEKAFRLSAGERRIPGKEDFRVYGRFVRERFDDFAWENDRVAFRAYGAALETWQDEPLTSSALDVWVKRTRRLVINDWYMVDDYHRDTGEGADLYSAGRSRGCGGSGIWKDGRLHASRNFRESRVLAAGPIRLVFELSYPPWDAGGVTVSEVKRITLDAGQNLNRIDSSYKTWGKGEIAHAAGIKKPAAAGVRSEKAMGWLRTWEAFRGDNGNLGCGIVVDPETLLDVTEADGNVLAVAKIRPEGRSTYWAGSAWDKGGDFASVLDWDRSLESASRRLRSPLRVEIEGR